MLKLLFPYCKYKSEDIINKTISSSDIGTVMSTYSIACEFDNSELKCKELFNGQPYMTHFDLINKCVKSTTLHKTIF